MIKSILVKYIYKEYNIKMAINFLNICRYEFKEKGLLKEEDSSNVPDVYIR